MCEIIYSRPIVVVFARGHGATELTDATSSLQGENGGLRNRSSGGGGGLLKVDINHVDLPSSGGSTGGGGGGGGVDQQLHPPNAAAAADLPDSSIGEGMDISIQGVNGHVKYKKGEVADPDAASIHSRGSSRHQLQMDSLQLPPINDKMIMGGYSSDMSIGRGMDISIRGDGDVADNKESSYHGGGPAWNNEGDDIDVYDSKEKIDFAAGGDNISYDEGDGDGDIVMEGTGKNVEEVLQDPVDEVVVEKCCPEVCYRVCPCCIGDPDSPFWQLWYRHRLQVSRYAMLGLARPVQYLSHSLFYLFS